MNTPTTERPSQAEDGVMCSIEHLELGQDRWGMTIGIPDDGSPARHLCPACCADVQSTHNDYGDWRCTNQRCLREWDMFGNPARKHGWW